MGQIEVFQLNRADVIGVRDLYLILIRDDLHSSGVGIGVNVVIRFNLSTITSFRYYCLCKDVLVIKESLDNVSDFTNRPLTAMQSGDRRNQYIGVMLDIVKIVVVLIVIMGAFVGIKVVSQIILQCTILFFSCKNIIIRNWISGCTECGNAALYQNGTGRSHVEDEDNHHHQCTGYDKAFLVLGNKFTDFLGFLGSFLCGFCCGFRCLDCLIGRVTGFRSSVFFFDGSLLLPPRIRIA